MKWSIYLFRIFIWPVIIIHGWPKKSRRNGTFTLRRSHMYSMEGLLNEEVVFLVTSSGREGGKYLRNRIIPSSRTWMKLLRNVFVVIEDSEESRFSLRHCRFLNHEVLPSFSCPNEPTIVLTTRCSSVYYSANGICCKVDEAINYLVEARPEIYKKSKFIIQSDDDMFWRVDKLFQWLAAVDKAGLESIPWIANGQISHSIETLSAPGGLFFHEGCHEIHTNGWYQPMVLNKAAVERFWIATNAMGVTSTCSAFQVSQDVGIGVVAWVLQLSHIYLPGIELNEGRRGISALYSRIVAVHSAKHAGDEEDCRPNPSWPESLRRSQAVVIGCGTLQRRTPGHNPEKAFDMYDAWHYFAKDQSATVIPLGGPRAHDWVQDPVTTVWKPKLAPLLGYNSTNHYYRHFQMNKWTTFTMKDCLVEGRLKM